MASRVRFRCRLTIWRTCVPARSASLTKAIQAKVRIREFMLGSLTPHTLWDPLLHSDLIQPAIFAPEALDLLHGVRGGSNIPVFKAAVDERSIRDHNGRLPFQAARPSFHRAGSPRLRNQRNMSSSRTWSQPSVASTGVPPVSFPQGDGRGAVLADLQCQVADLKAQLHAPVSGPDP